MTTWSVYMKIYFICLEYYSVRNKHLHQVQKARSLVDADATIFTRQNKCLATCICASFAREQKSNLFIEEKNMKRRVRKWTIRLHEKYELGEES